MFKIDKKKKVLLKAKLKKRHQVVEIPSTISCVGERSFDRSLYLKEVIFSNTVEIIGDSAFYGCNSLENVVLTDSIKEICFSAFADCSNLININLPNSLKRIGGRVFEDDECLEEIIIPSSVEYIDSYAFKGTSIKSIELPAMLDGMGEGVLYHCKYLESVKIPKYISFLGRYFFYRCESLKNIELPESLTAIGVSAFGGCVSLEKIILPKGLLTIYDEAFAGCRGLKNIDIPKSVVSIRKGAFENCINLESINFHFGLQSIGDKAFSKCTAVKDVSIPDSVTELGAYVFYGCDDLERVKLSKLIKNIDVECFSGCFNLKEVNLPSNLQSISKGVFEGCKSLEHIVLPDTLKSIRYRAFYGCRNLKEISIPSSVEEIDDLAFALCRNLETIKLGNFNLLHEKGIGEIIENYKYIYVNENTEELIIRKKPLNRLGDFKRVVYDNYWCYDWDNYENVLFSIVFGRDKLKTIGDFKYVFPYIYKGCMNRDNYKIVAREIIGNGKEFKNLIKILSSRFYDIKHNGEEYYALFKFAYALGAFSDDGVQRQRTCEFLSNAFDKRYLCFSNIEDVFEDLNEFDFNSEWASFIMQKDNFFDLVRQEEEAQGFIAKTYIYFDEIKEFGRSNKGNQHFRKVTPSMCKKYLEKINFKGVNPRNEDISDEISKYTRSQEAFDEASKIRDEYLELRSKGQIKDHLLDEEIKEDVFEKIDEIRKKTLKESILTLKILGKVAKESFSYEFLSKYDATNFVLGKYCSCCAHLEGAGLSIVKGSILNPDCQNIVIRNSKGQIVAKSTLYVNRKEGYGVLNTVSVNDNIDLQSREKIYDKFMEAIAVFVEKYNAVNSDKPLKQINVGMSINSLSNYFVKRNKRANIILQGLDFYEYGDYGGDWQDDQRIVWKAR